MAISDDDEDDIAERERFNENVERVFQVLIEDAPIFFEEVIFNKAMALARNEGESFPLFRRCDPIAQGLRKALLSNKDE